MQLSQVMVAVSVISVLFATCMIAGTGWTLGTRITPLKIKFNDLRIPEPSPLLHGSNQFEETYYNTYHDILKTWESTRPVVIPCTITTLLIGVLQIIFSTFVVTSSVKRIQKRIKRWLAFQLIAFTILVATLVIVLITLSKHNGISISSWNNTVDRFHESLIQTTSNSLNYDSITKFLKTGSLVTYYSVVGANIGGTFTAAFTAFYCIRKDSLHYATYY